VYDKCDVCGGASNTCLDCAHIPNGPTRYDVCDVCGGTGSTCRDCKGIANGPNIYDVCDVCGGNGNTCLDCAGKLSTARVLECQRTSHRTRKRRCEV
jgi:hypothetical protein